MRVKNLTGSESITNTVFDRNLYGPSFWLYSFPFLLVVLWIQYYVYYPHSTPLFGLYTVFIVTLVFLSSLMTKNFRKDFHVMRHWMASLFLFAGLLSFPFAYVGRFEETMMGLLQRILALSISELCLLFSLIHIVVIGQRTSLRNSIGLSDNLFSEKRSRWESELGGFPNLGRIVEPFDEGRFLVGLFDAGYFNLTILWSCNIMEKIIDRMIEGIVQRNCSKRPVFIEESGRLSYPRKLRNLGFEYSQRGDSKQEFDLELLWYRIRNRIAHHNYRPTFRETRETAKILVSFLEDMPKIFADF